MSETMTVNDVIQKRLPPRYALIIQRRYGLGDEDEHTVSELAASLNITSGRTRQILKLILTRLRKPHPRKGQRL